MGPGDPATPNGTLYLPTITLGGQGRLSTNLAAFKAQLQGAKWGSIVVSAPAQSIVAHTVMRSAVKGVACSSSFVDPRISTSTTKVASALKLDYDSLTKPCIMVCNASSTDTRTVTANFQTDSGVPIPSQQVTLAPGQQKMIVVDPQQVLSAHQSAMADVRLSYAGNGSDIVAGGVSMSAAEDYASGARFVEPRSTDGKHLMSPFFRVDARTPGFVQISNLGSSSVMAGVSMKFANSTLPPVTSEMVSVAAGRTATLDVQKYIEQTPDGLTAEGCLSLIHNGAPGTVTCSFVSMTPDPVETPLEPGPPMCHTTVFPNEIETQPGETTQVRVITCGGQGAVVFSASAGTITPQPSSDPDVFVASYTVPDDDSEPDTAIITVTSADGVSTSQVEIQKVKLRSIDTSTGGRLNPDGGTTFMLTGKRDFPAVPLQVRFEQGDNRVSVDIPVGNISGTTLTGTAPPNTLFVGDAAIKVFADSGNTKVSKKTLCDDSGCSAYYAFNPPSPATSTSVPGFDRRGGSLTITAQGGGIRTFSPASVPPVPPLVKIEGGIPFTVQVASVTDTTIVGTVERTQNRPEACQFVGAQGPCYRITIRNPGGRKVDDVPSASPLYNLMPGPTPFFGGRIPDIGPSVGGTPLTIFGKDLDFVEIVRIDGTPVIFQLTSPTEIEATTQPHAAISAPIELVSVDRIVVSGFSFGYRPSTPDEKTDDYFAVGPGESIQAQDITHDNTCVIPNPTTGVRIDEEPLPSSHLPGVLPPNRGFHVTAGNATLGMGCPSGVVCYSGKLRAKIVNSLDSGKFAQWNKFTIFCF